MAESASSNAPPGATNASTPPADKPLQWSWQQTMLRVKDPQKSLKFYCDLLGFTYLDRVDVPELGFSAYFLTTLPADDKYTFEPGTADAHRFLWTYAGVVLELRHNHGTETAQDFKYHPGNEEKDGFCNVAVNCDDVALACEELEKEGVTLKKPDAEDNAEGPVYAHDPDGYLIQLIKRPEGHTISVPYNFSKVKLRVKDPKKTIPFYQSLGMTVVKEHHDENVSFYTLATLPEGTTAPTDSDEANPLDVKLFHAVLELMHTHGTEKQDDFHYNDGNEDPFKGFGHIGFLVNDVDAACTHLDKLGYGILKRSMDAKLKGVAFAKDPDGYWVEVIKRGGYGADSMPHWLEPSRVRTRCCQLWPKLS